MTDRARSIALAALRVYGAKGVRRATMTDVATEAAVTRQTVYNTFGSTDGVLQAAVRCYVDDLWQQIVDGWADCDTLEQKLDLLLHHFAIEPWDYLNSSPHAAELERGYNEAGRAALEEARLDFHGDVAALFEPWNDHLADQGTTPMAVAEFISAAIEGLKYNNETRDGMLLAVATLKASLLGLTKP